MFDLILFLVLFLRKTLYVVKAIFIVGCGLPKPRVYFFEIHSRLTILLILTSIHNNILLSVVVN